MSAVDVTGSSASALGSGDKKKKKRSSGKAFDDQNRTNQCDQKLEFY